MGDTMSEDSRPRVAVNKGLTLPLGNYASSRVDYRVEADVASGLSIAQALDDLEGTIDRKLEAFKAKHAAFRPASELQAPVKGVAAEKPPAPTEPEVPELDPSFLDTLPWKAFASGKGEWIFANTEGAEVLREELSQADKKMLVIGKHRYRVSGTDDRFVQRFPAETQKK